MYKISVTMSFSAAHNLRGYRGMCEELHGHNWKIQVTFGASKLDETGMVEDFKHVKEDLRGVLKTLDHKYLNNVPPFKAVNPTSENIARYIFLQIKARKKSRRAKVISVTVWETDSSSATYCQ